MRCTNCNQEFFNNAKFCPWCGAKAETMKKSVSPEGVESEKECSSGTKTSEPVLINKAIPDYSPVPTDSPVINATGTKKVKTVSKSSASRLKPGHIEKSAGARFDDAFPRTVTTTDHRTTKKSSSAEYKGLIIALASVVVLSISFLVLYFCTDLFKGDSEVYACSICDAQIAKNEKFCEKCSVEYKCKNCDIIDEKVKKGYCKQCRDEYICVKCGEFSESLSKGYCHSCVGDYTCNECGEISDFITKGFCEDCVEDFTCEECGEVENTVENGYCETCIEKYKCKACDEFSKELEEGFCEDCVTDYTCRFCDKIDENAESGYCSECNGKYICKMCDKFNKKLTDGYCDQCIKAYKCGKCGKVDKSVRSGKCDDCKLSEVGKKVSCSSCTGSTYTNVAYKDNAGNYYCDDCDTGYYCSTCKAPTSGAGESYCNKHKG